MRSEARILTVLLLAMALIGCAKSESPAPAASVAQRDFVALDRELLSLLQAGEFDRLDALLSEVMREHEADRGKERQVEVAFDAFYRANVDLEPALGKWVEAKPNSYAAHLARASYYTAVAWAKRQGRYAVHTPDEQFAAMREYFAKAASDLAVARRLKPDAVQPIVYQMEGIINDGDPKAMQRLYEEAMRIDPTSLAVRWQYLWSLLPRWGGSIEQMEDVVEDARRYYDRNPALRILEGRVEAESGSQALLDHDCATATPHLDAALKAGDHWYYLHESAMRDFACGGPLVDVIEKLRRAIAYRPNAINVYQTALLLGRSLYGRSQYAEAIDVLSVQLTINPKDDKSRQLRGDSYHRVGRIDEALADFEENIRQVPDNSEYASDLKTLQTLIEDGTCAKDSKHPGEVWVCKEG